MNKVDLVEDKDLLIVAKEIEDLLVYERRYRTYSYRLLEAEGNYNHQEQSNDATARTFSITINDGQYSKWKDER